MPQQIIPDEVEGKAKPKAEAIHLELHSTAIAALDLQLLRMKQALFLNRSYEDEDLYFLVFKPFNKTYKDNISFYNKKALDAIRKNFNNTGVYDYFISREINATKTHFNALLYSKQDMVSMYDGKNRLNRFRVRCTKIPKLDRFRVMNYITKEARLRPFLHYIDFLLGVA